VNPALLVAVVHYIVGVAALGCLIGFGVIATADGLPPLELLIGAGVGGGLVLITPTGPNGPATGGPSTAAPTPTPGTPATPRTPAS
jgi:hypothetical protein